MYTIRLLSFLTGDSLIQSQHFIPTNPIITQKISEFQFISISNDCSIVLYQIQLNNQSNELVKIFPCWLTPPISSLPVEFMSNNNRIDNTIVSISLKYTKPLSGVQNNTCLNIFPIVEFLSNQIYFYRDFIGDWTVIDNNIYKYAFLHYLKHQDKINQVQTLEKSTSFDEISNEINISNDLLSFLSCPDISKDEYIEKLTLLIENDESSSIEDLQESNNQSLSKQVHVQAEIDMILSTVRMIIHFTQLLIYLNFELSFSLVNSEPKFYTIFIDDSICSTLRCRKIYQLLQFIIRTIL